MKHCEWHNWVKKMEKYKEFDFKDVKYIVSIYLTNIWNTHTHICNYFESVGLLHGSERELKSSLAVIYFDSLISLENHVYI